MPHSAVPSSQPPRPRAAVIMAAGQGTRMKSPTPKVLHKVGGRTLIDHVIDTVEQAGCERIVVVTGASGQVRDHVARRLGEAAIAVQDQPLGTAHAVLAAKERLADFDGEVLVINGDCPLVEPEHLAPLFGLLAEGAGIALVGFEPRDQLLYGRLIQGADGHVIRIVEPREAKPEEALVKTCNAGMYAADHGRLFGWLARVDDNNAKREFYLTDIVKLAVAEDVLVRASMAPESAVMGCDTQAQLSAAEAIFQQRRRAHFLAEGVAMPAPESVHFSWDTQIAPGAGVEQFVVFSTGVVVETGAQIRAFSHLEAARVREGAIVGPYARLRPGADIGEQAHVGNFVEVKNVALGKGAKANHLAYLGDGSVGAGANIGAGVIFCNYDGYGKYQTHVGAGAFIGSDSALVAPVTVGEGAYVGTGSVITDDVSPDALALARGRQVEKPGWAAAFRASRIAAKAKS
ncbi:bifunctional UDP-N-acetylglucosamine diphosphorylase/glucosamine-1-phosphate N-acetyltransferase GlmU [Phenylobacterium sp.]|uniref:bifunctional UDP-N-acetylglucosamine diphosphorylase/glucosamine-1-phosphate N-acetyltransferase GlmU n=1 Tax=Phenylobacterium sp. TaxID=1871053 RepID=UPI00273739D0|nr:bifunctional UDP-N-acetylglucosamine diphosphorylase/glucosamine-1-phosphate N-acetyltransferase GlmU [Phenylobacterium sp.]MDP3660971.1 bifunctional UDP-N-acetylglucosamine diphosphorylase/glucosamine-1-phosphate N-acetyltransferase GlmU [Phenylobacterium sp.]